MRTSKIQNVYINNVSNSSIFICGNTGCIRSRFKENRETFHSSSQLSDNGVSESVLFPDWLDCKDEENEFTILNDASGLVIGMKDVRVLSITSGTTFQIGTSDSIDLESRISEFKRVKGA